MCSEVVHDRYLAFFQARRQHLHHVGLEDTGGRRSLYGQRVGPITSMVMLDSKVVFLPRLRGTLSRSRSPLGA